MALTKTRAWFVVGLGVSLCAGAGLASCGDDASSSPASADASTDGTTNGDDDGTAGGDATGGGDATTVGDATGPDADASDGGDGAAGDAGRAWVYFAGGSTGNSFLGFAWDPTMRKLTPLDTDPGTPGTQNFTTGTGPIAIAAHPSGAWVYTANFIDDTVSGLAHDANTGMLTRFAANEADGGQDLPVKVNPVFIAADPKGRCLYVASQVSFLDTLTINPTNGKLTFARETATASIAQWIAVDPMARFLVVGGTGGQLMIHRLDATTGLPLAVDGGVDTGTAYSVPANSYIVTLRPEGTAVYVAATSANAIRGFAIDPVALTLTPFADVVDAGYPAAVAVEPRGKFLYSAETSGGVNFSVRAIAADGTLGAVLGSTLSYGNCVALSFVPDGLTLFGHCSGGGAVVPIDPATGAMSARVAGGFGQSRNTAWVVR